MTVLAILAGWWAFLALAAVAVCRAADKPVPPVRVVRAEPVGLAGIEWDWKRS